MAPDFGGMRLFILLVALGSMACGGDQRSRVTIADTIRAATDEAVRTSNRSPELASRADSLERLDPEQEAHAAIARGDLRFLAVCGYVCLPVGVPWESILRSADSSAVRGDRVRGIPGTSDSIRNEDVARLNTVAADYAARYNHVIWTRLKGIRASRPAT